MEKITLSQEARNYFRQCGKLASRTSEQQRANIMARWSLVCSKCGKRGHRVCPVCEVACVSLGVSEGHRGQGSGSDVRKTKSVRKS